MSICASGRGFMVALFKTYTYNYPVTLAHCSLDSSGRGQDNANAMTFHEAFC